MDSAKAASVHSSDAVSPSMAVPVKDAPIVPYEDDNEKLNSTMQLAWSEVMQEGHYTSSTEYRHVHVLMLSWETRHDDLKVQEEIDALKTVFEQTFNYHVTHERLIKRDNKKTQTQVNSIVAGWVDKYDGPKTLLLVYFAGHGRPGKRQGDLQITGTKSLFEVDSELNEVTWNRAENNLLETVADVLQIFDCCYAGSLGGRGDSRAFEYLAACAADQTTPRPGEHSFTRALIWALERLSVEMKSARFTTSHLLRKIIEAPDFPKDQRPEFRKRPGANPRERIMLQPVRPGQEESPPTAHANGTDGPTNHTTSPELDAAHHTGGRHQDILTLKFIFETRPDVEDVRKLGSDLNKIVYKHDFHLNGIVFGGLVPRDNDMVFKAVSHFKRNARRKMSRGGHHASNSNGNSAGAHLHHHQHQHRSLAESAHVADAVQQAAATFAEAIEHQVETDVQERIHGEIHDEVRREFDAQSANRRAENRER